MVHMKLQVRAKGLFTLVNLIPNRPLPLIDSFQNESNTSNTQVYGIALVGIMLILAGAAYGMNFRLSPDWRPVFFRGISLAWLGGLCALAALVLTFSGRLVATELLSRVGAWSCLAQLGLTAFFNLPTQLAIAAITAGAFATWIIARRFGPNGVMLGAMVGGVAGFVASLVFIGIDRADMLPFIGHAIDVFVAGEDPYAADFSSITPNPFFYPPVQWLIFLPLKIAGLDIRILNLVCAAGLILLVETQGRWRRNALRAGVYPILLSPLAFPMMHSGQVWPYWLTIVIFGLLVLGRRWMPAALVVAIAVGIRQTALVPAAAVFTVMLMWERPRISVRTAAVGAAVMAVVFVPLVVWSDRAIGMIFVEGPRLAQTLAHRAGNPLDQIALSNWLGWLGLERWDTGVEIALALAVVALTIVAARRGTGRMLAMAGIGYALTVAANPYVHRYYYVAGLLLFVIGLADDTVWEKPQRWRQTRVDDTA